MDRSVARHVNASLCKGGMSGAYDLLRCPQIKFPPSLAIRICGLYCRPLSRRGCCPRPRGTPLLLERPHHVGPAAVAGGVQRPDAELPAIGMFRSLVPERVQNERVFEGP